MLLDPAEHAPVSLEEQGRCPEIPAALRNDAEVLAIKEVSDALEAFGVAWSLISPDGFRKSLRRFLSNYELRATAHLRALLPRPPSRTPSPSTLTTFFLTSSCCVSHKLSALASDIPSSRRLFSSPSPVHDPASSLLASNPPKALRTWPDRPPTPLSPWLLSSTPDLALYGLNA